MTILRLVDNKAKTVHICIVFSYFHVSIATYVSFTKKKKKNEMKFFFISFSFHLSFILIQVWKHYNLFTFSGSSSNPIENECQPIIIDRYHLSSRSSMHVIYTAVWKNSHYNNRLIFVFNRTTKIEQREKAISGCK